MPIAYHTTYSDLYTRVTTHADGAAVRALVNSIFPASELDKVMGKVFPWLVWRPIGIGGESNTMREVGGSWWIYSEPTVAWYTLYEIASALETLYGGNNELAMPYGRIKVTHIGRPETDAALNGAIGLEVRIGYRRLG